MQPVLSLLRGSCFMRFADRRALTSPTLLELMDSPRVGALLPIQFPCATHLPCLGAPPWLLKHPIGPTRKRKASNLSP